MINTSKTILPLASAVVLCMCLMLCWHVNRLKKEAAKDQHVSLVTVNVSMRKWTITLCLSAAH